MNQGYRVTFGLLLYKIWEHDSADSRPPRSLAELLRTIPAENSKIKSTYYRYIKMIKLMSSNARRAGNCVHSILQ